MGGRRGGRREYNSEVPHDTVTPRESPGRTGAPRGPCTAAKHHAASVRSRTPLPCSGWPGRLRGAALAGGDSCTAQLRHVADNVNTC